MMYVPLLVNRCQKCILLIVEYKYLKYVPEIFILQNLILRTRLCGTGFITQPSCVLDFHLTESVRGKWFVLAVYRFWKGISAGPALKYFTWCIGAGGLINKVKPYVISVCVIRECGSCKYRNKGIQELGKRQKEVKIGLAFKRARAKQLYIVRWRCVIFKYPKAPQQIQTNTHTQN